MSEQEKQLVNNDQLIAEFMGWKVCDNEYGVLFFGYREMFDEESFDCTKEELDKLYDEGHLDAWFTHQDSVKFSSSWDWLMPVLRKCHEVTIGTSWSKVNCLAYTLSQRDFMCENAIKFIYAEVVGFIKWYNEYGKNN